MIAGTLRDETAGEVLCTLGDSRLTSSLYTKSVHACRRLVFPTIHLAREFFRPVPMNCSGVFASIGGRSEYFRALGRSFDYSDSKSACVPLSDDTAAQGDRRTSVNQSAVRLETRCPRNNADIAQTAVQAAKAHSNVPPNGGWLSADRQDRYHCYLPT